MSSLGRKGRVFYAFLLSYLLILLIPVFMSVLLFNRAQNIVTTESDRGNELLLQQMNTYLDSVMTDLVGFYEVLGVAGCQRSGRSGKGPGVRCAFS